MSEIRSVVYLYVCPINTARSRDSSVLWYFSGKSPEWCQFLHWCLIGIQNHASCTTESSTCPEINPVFMKYTSAYEYSKSEVRFSDLIAAIATVK
jgi:hypothetical protein